MEVRERLVDLLSYAGHMAGIGERPAFALAEYKGEVFHEQELRNRLGIQHDVSEGEDRVWLKVARLVRLDPPPVPDTIKPWLSVGRDPSREPTIQQVRAVTVPVAEAEALVAGGLAREADVAPALKPKGGVAAEALRDVILRLDSDAKAKAAIAAYIDGPWRRWAEEEKPRRQTIRIYESLFSLQQAVETQGVERPLEVVWGVGVARWKHPVRPIDHPLVEQLVEIEVDDTDGAIRIRPRSLEPGVALKCYQDLENPGADALLRAAREHFATSATEFSPFVRTSFEPVLRRAVALLDPEGRYHPDELEDIDDRIVPEAAPTLVVTDTWVIYARTRSANVVIEDIERLKTSVEKTTPESVPGAAARLVSLPDAGGPSDGFAMPLGMGTGVFGNLAEGSALESALHDFYFPKPFNEDQVDILRRLEREDGVIVQGPPGTGKTHTIANIICHFMATGRRVLVTSHGEGALGVLRDQIPGEIRDLVISLLTSERQGLKQLEQAVRLLADEVSQQNQRALGQAIDEGERRVIDLRRKIAGIDAELRRYAELHSQRLGGAEGPLPMELARRVVADRQRHGWLEDRPSVGQAPPVTDEAFAALRDARKRLGEDIAYVGVALPSPNDLPDAAVMAAIHNDLVNAQELSHRIRAGEIPPMSLTADRAMERAEALRRALEALGRALEARSAEPWLAALAPLGERAGATQDTGLFAGLRGHLEEAQNGRRRFIEKPVEVPEEAFKERAVFDGLVEALTRQASGQAAFGYLSFGRGRLKSIHAEIRVAGEPVTDADAAKHTSDYFAWRKRLSQLRLHWNKVAPEAGLPPLEYDGEQVGRWAAEVHAKIGQQTVAAEYHAVAVQELPVLFPFGLSLDGLDRDHTVAHRLREALHLNLARHRLDASRVRLGHVRDRLALGEAPILEEMRRFVQESIGQSAPSGLQISEAWDRLLTRLRNLRDLAPALDTVADLSAKIGAGGAPRWAERLRTVPWTGVEDPLTPVDWKEAWAWAQYDSYLRSIDARASLERLSKARSEAGAELERAFQRVVRDRTYLALNRSLSDRIRAALVSFVSAIKQIGAGTGIRARRFRRDARDAMDRCYQAVPCWIMPTWRVSESLPSVLGSFDLVIVDEASQSDVLALPALLRGRKVLVVGDDQQVSPVAVGVEEKRILQLRQNYLQQQPFAQHLLPGQSLYDLMSAVFPSQRIMLKEHFRCVEPIIRFSAKEFYDNKLRPLRIPRASERLDPPLVDILVEHGTKTAGKINLAEAEAIVEEIARIAEDPLLAHRSIGVVSLVGAAQAQKVQTMLLEALGEEVFVRHAIACGDSATFQGKERDIMFVSMVDSPNAHATKTAQMFRQRFNVALSRARDRMYLVRSVDESMLKPDDLNAKVIRHFKNPMEGSSSASADALDLCESPFEREVYTKLTERGWRVRPQVKAGDYRIDLVVEGADDKRLAVELDGDQYHGPDRWTADYTRQLALERMGWQFWRCWGSSWALDQEECLADLERTLRAKGIEPIGATGGTARYTEHRIIRAPVADDLGTGTSSASTESEASAGSADASPDGGAAPGDLVVLVFTDEPGRHRSILLTEEDQDDPSMGVVSTRRPIGRALLGCVEDDLVDVPAGDRTRAATILRVEQRGAKVTSN